MQRLDGQWAVIVCAAARTSEHICAKTRHAVLSVLTYAFVSMCEPVQRLDGQWAVSAAARKSEHMGRRLVRVAAAAASQLPS